MFTTRIRTHTLMTQQSEFDGVFFLTIYTILFKLSFSVHLVHVGEYCPSDNSLQVKILNTDAVLSIRQNIRWKACFYKPQPTGQLWAGRGGTPSPSRSHWVRQDSPDYGDVVLVVFHWFWRSTILKQLHVTYLFCYQKDTRHQLRQKDICRKQRNAVKTEIEMIVWQPQTIPKWMTFTVLALPPPPPPPLSPPSTSFSSSVLPLDKSSSFWVSEVTVWWGKKT